LHEKALTIDDIARLARVNKSTVSRVINNTRGVTISEKTRARVLAIIEKTGFRKHAVASRLKSGFRDIAVVVAEPEPDLVFHPIYQELLTRLTLAFGRLGKHVAIHHYTTQAEENLRNNLDASLYAGVVILGSHPYRAFDAVAAHIPTLRIFHDHPSPRMSFFLQDHAQAAGLCLSFLRARGLRRIHAVFYAQSRLLRDREAAIRAAAATMPGLELNAIHLKRTESHDPLEPEVLHRLADEARLPDLVRGKHEVFLLAADALGLWQYFISHGVLAPRDTSIMAWDRPVSHKHLAPGLSAVGIDYEALADKVCGFFEKTEMNVTELIPSVLYEGTTVAGG